jgi:hypothetical protein
MLLSSRQNIRDLKRTRSGDSRFCSTKLTLLSTFAKWIAGATKGTRQTCSSSAPKHKSEFSVKCLLC